MIQRDILSGLAAGERMSDEEFEFLFNEGDCLQIAATACLVRDQKYSDRVVTFIIDRNINYTNICSCRCSFCAFYRDKEAEDAYVIEPAVLMAKVDEAVRLGANQLMIQGGLNPDLQIGFFEDMFRSIKQRYDITIHSLTAPEIDYIARISGLSIEECLKRLQKAGLDSLPGGGAEVLHDEIRERISPNKISSSRWLGIMESAHKLGIKGTATMMMGSTDRLEHRLHHLASIRDLQDRTGGFRAFIAWTYQPGNTELQGEKYPSFLYLKFLALSRLYLDNFAHIQGSWLTQGPRIGQMALFFGADDLGSIMLEENVVKAAGVANTISTSQMVRLIRESGMRPAERNSRYERLKYF